MDGIISGPGDNSVAAVASQKSACGPDKSADRREIKYHHYHDDEKECEERCIHKIAECVSILKGTAEEILNHLREQPGAEQVATILGGAIQRIEQLLKNRCFDLDKIKNGLDSIEEDIRLIKQYIHNPTSALEEIKRDIHWIETHMGEITGFCPDVTSGSIIVEDPQSTQVLVAVKNTTSTARTVRVRVLRDDICPAAELADKCLMVSGCCSNAITASFDDASAYEIEVFGLVPGMTVSSIELDICKRRIKCSRLTASQFICLREKCS